MEHHALEMLTAQLKTKNVEHSKEKVRRLRTSAFTEDTVDLLEDSMEMHGLLNAGKMQLRVSHQLLQPKLKHKP